MPAYLLVAIAAIVAGLAMAVKPVWLLRRIRRTGRHRRRRPDYFAVNLLRLAGFLLVCVGILLTGEIFLRAAPAAHHIERDLP